MLNDSTMILSIVPYIDCMIDKELLYRSDRLELITGELNMAVWILDIYSQYQQKFRLRTFTANLVEVFGCHGESVYFNKINLCRQIVRF